MTRGGRWRIGLLLVLLATAVRSCWTLLVPTIPVGDFAMYRESAIYLAEFGHLDSGFVYMPGLVFLLAALHRLGGDVLAAKMLGVACGGLAAAPVYVICARLIDGVRDGVAPRQGRTAAVPRAANARGQGDAAALVAGLAYALWPAGIAMSSVIGTDIPTAAIILLALSLLCVFGPTRPWWAAALFGAGMGMAAYFRAVALPLTLLSAAYWLARRESARAIVMRTAFAAAVTVLALIPWGWRNRARSGEFYLTDSHGGITALMGNNPNTEGTYARSLTTMFRQLTGRTFLMEPHRQTDRAAYQLAKQFMTFDPTWTAGMVALRLERLFAPERGLLYWPIYRPGVIPSPDKEWFNQHRAGITLLTDCFYLLFVVSLCAGLAFAMVERRWLVLVPLPFALAMAATYALFVAEPRYRVTSEVVLFPLVGFGAWRLGTSGFRLWASWTRGAGSRGWRRWLGRLGGPALQNSSPGIEEPGQTVARRGLIVTLVACATLTVLGVIVVRGGEALRRRHRWAATVWSVDGQAQLATWRPRAVGNGPSPVRAAPPGAALILLPGQRQAEAVITIAGPSLPTAGARQFAAALAWRGQMAAGTRVSIGGLVAPMDSGSVRGPLASADGSTRIVARLERALADDGLVEVMISDVALTTGESP